MSADRSGELETLRRRYAECVPGRGQLVLVSGPVASGKTWLANRFGERVVDDGGLFLGAIGSPDEQQVPFGVVDQLLRGCEWLADAAEPLDWLIRDSTTKVRSGWKVGAPQAGALQALLSSLLRAAKDRPVVIALDDAEHADPESQHCLLYLARRLRQARVLMIFFVRHESQHRHSPFLTELPRQHNCRQLALAPLAVDTIREALAANLGSGPAMALADAYHRISGGNPYLVRSLLEDQVVDDGDRAVRPTPGATFDAAVLACLDRAGPAALQVARALAVLGEAATVPRLARLLGHGEREIRRRQDDLQAMGLIGDCGFRHPAVRQAILEDMPADARATMHSGAAGLIHLGGEPAVQVARHIVAADRTPDEDTRAVLREAAEQALAAGDLSFAARCLDLALRGCADAAERLAITGLLATVEWRINPWSAAPRLPSLADAVREQRLGPRCGTRLVRSLLWLGRSSEAMELLGRLGDAATDVGADPGAELDGVRQGLTASHPALAEPAGALFRATATARGRGLLPRVLAGGGDESTLWRAEEVLRQETLDDHVVEQVIEALLALLYADRGDRAAAWCDTLLERVERIGVPTWLARLTAVRAEIALRHGDLPEARRLARSALERLPLRGWGVAVGSPLATLIRSCSLMGRYAEAEEALRQAVPDEMSQTRFWPAYVYARGCHHLQRHRWQQSLADFRACGRQVRAWRTDVPGFVMWRSGAALAHLGLKQPGEARKLMEEQLARVGDRPSRSRGVSLRILAAATELRGRPVLLRKAADILQQCGDQWELAVALGDLQQAHRTMGDGRRAATVLQQALRLARQVGAEPLHGVLEQGGAPKGEGEILTFDQEGAQALQGLSTAERRVTELAAVGLSNREIASRLYITISTVEQHLTRVYKKLKVSSRMDLAVVCSAIGGEATLSAA